MEGSPLSFQPCSVQFQEQRVKKLFDSLLLPCGFIAMWTHCSAIYFTFCVWGYQSCRYDLIFFFAFAPPHTAICRHLQVPQSLVKCFLLILCPFFLFCFVLFLSTLFILCLVFLVLPLVSQCKTNKVWILLNKSVYFPSFDSSVNFLGAADLHDKSQVGRRYTARSPCKAPSPWLQLSGQLPGQQRYQVQALLCLALCVQLMWGQQAVFALKKKITASGGRNIHIF